MAETKVIKCGACGEELESPLEYHTYESCLLHRLNAYRISIGKLPVEIDIKREDIQLEAEKQHKEPELK